MKSLYILAGANGSGKSTVAKVLLPEDGIEYINPDDIAKEINPADLSAVRIQAGKEALKRVADLLERGESFAIESTLSGVAYVKLLERAKQLGYETAIAYVFVDSPEVCIARIATRVRTGGHFVPDEDVRRRYLRSKENFFKTYRKLVDHWTLFCNSGTSLVLVADEVGVYDRQLLNQFTEGL